MVNILVTMQKHGQTQTIQTTQEAWKSQKREYGRTGWVVTEARPVEGRLRTEVMHEIPVEPTPEPEVIQTPEGGFTLVPLPPVEPTPEQQFQIQVQAARERAGIVEPTFEQVAVEAEAKEAEKYTIDISGRPTVTKVDTVIPSFVPEKEIPGTQVVSEFPKVGETPEEKLQKEFLTFQKAEKFKEAPPLEKGLAVAHTFLSPSGTELIAALPPGGRVPEQVIGERLAISAQMKEEPPLKIAAVGGLGFLASPPGMISTTYLGGVGLGAVSRTAVGARVLGAPITKIGFAGLVGIEGIGIGAKAVKGDVEMAGAEALVLGGALVGGVAGFKVGAALVSPRVRPTPLALRELKVKEIFVAGKKPETITGFRFEPTKPPKKVVSADAERLLADYQKTLTVLEPKRARRFGVTGKIVAVAEKPKITEKYPEYKFLSESERLFFTKIPEPKIKVKISEPGIISPVEITTAGKKPFAKKPTKIVTTKIEFREPITQKEISKLGEQIPGIKQLGKLKPFPELAITEGIVKPKAVPVISAELIPSVPRKPKVAAKPERLVPVELIDIGYKALEAPSLVSPIPIIYAPGVSVVQRQLRQAPRLMITTAQIKALRAETFVDTKVTQKRAIKLVSVAMPKIDLGMDVFVAGISDVGVKTLVPTITKKVQRLRTPFEYPFEVPIQRRPKIVPAPPTFYLPKLKGRAVSMPKGFDVEVRKARKWVKKTREPLLKSEAIKYGAFIAETTPRASFRIVPTEKAPSLRKIPYVFRAERFRKPVRRTKIKGAGEIWIEKTKYRIDMPGELKGITLKGLRAPRKKKAKGRRRSSVFGF